MGTVPDAYADTLEAEAAPIEDASDHGDAEEAPAISRRRARRADPTGQAVADTAASLIGDRRMVVHGTTYRHDCSGLVEASHAGADVSLAGSSKSMYELARREGLLHKRKRPTPGDVVFFDNTYDRNHNGRRDDLLSHVAVVESVDRYGTITLVHKGSRGVVNMHMNLDRPHLRRDEDGRSLNSYLRATSDRDKGPTLSGELFKAFGSLWALEDGQATAYAD
jgi:peptidoglycan DL-endopeptidase CwlO